MLRGPTKTHGFTLLEVLIALVVLALALVALTRTAAQQTAQFSALRDRTVAGWVAANALAELRLEPGMPAAGEHEGTMEMAKRRWQYRITVRDTAARGIRRIHVEVFDPAGRPDAGPLVSLDGFAGAALAQ